MWRRWDDAFRYRWLLPYMQKRWEVAWTVLSILSRWLCKHSLSLFMFMTSSLDFSCSPGVCVCFWVYFLDFSVLWVFFFFYFSFLWVYFLKLFCSLSCSCCVCHGVEAVSLDFSSLVLWVYGYLLLHSIHFFITVTTWKTKTQHHHSAHRFAKLRVQINCLNR